MKKMIFSAAAFGLVAVSSMALAPTTAEAIPAFARQTGAACLSCHFQEVPALKAFGRAFKMNAFTDVGDQALVEDDNLSIPSVLNLSFVVRANMTKVSGDPTAANNLTAYNIPVDQNLLLAGRVGTNTGVFLEFGGGTGDTAGGLNNMQVMNSFDLGGFKVGLGYADDSFGSDSILNVNSVYGQHSGNIGAVGDVSAINNSGFTNSMTQIGAWVGNDLGFIEFALIAPGGSAGWTVSGTADNGINATNGAVDVGLKLAKMVKAVATLDVGGFDTLVGGGFVAGKVTKLTGTSTSTPSMNEQFLFAQMQGDLGDMTLGIYADWAHAKGRTEGNLLGAQDVATVVPAGSTLVSIQGPDATVAAGAYNALGADQKFDAYSIRASLEPVSQIAVALGYGYRKSTNLATVNQPKHQVFKLGAAYSVYQNMILALSYQNDKVSGDLTASKNTNIKTTVLDYVIYM